MSRLWTPSSSRPRYQCDVCGEAKFYEGEDRAYQDHVAKCARENAAELAAVSEIAHARRNPLEQSVDREAVEFQRRRYGT